MVSTSMFTLLPTQFNHALKLGKSCMFTNTNEEEDFFGDVFVNIQDNISVIIPHVKFPSEIWGRLILHTVQYIPQK